MAGIANIGSFASGLMRGHLTATEEQRREEDQAFLKEQRGQTRDEWNRAEAIRRGIAALPQVGSQQTRRVKDPQAIMDTGDENQFMDEAYSYTPEMRQQALAGLYRQYGREDLAGGAEDRGYSLFKQGRERGQIERVDTALSNRAQHLKDLKELGLAGYAEKHGRSFNGDLWGGPKFAGHTVSFASTPKGQMVYMHDPSGNVSGKMPYTEASVLEFINSLTDAELSAASPEMYSQVATRGIQRGQLGAQQTTAAAAMRNAQANEDYRNWMQGRPTYQQSGDGTILQFGPSGNLLGTFGRPRPLPGSGGRQLSPDAVKELNVAAAAVDAAKTPQERLAAQQKFSNLYTIAMTSLGKVMKPGEVKGLYPGTADQDPQLAALDTQAQQLLAKMTGDNYGATQDALKDIERQRSVVMLKRQISGLTPEERVPEASNLLKQGATPEVLQQLGFTQEEVRAARKYRPAAQPGAATATNPTAKPPKTGDTRVSSLSAEEAGMPVGDRIGLGLQRARGESTTGTDTRSVTERLFGR
jgi:hypothetical protein